MTLWGVMRSVSPVITSSGQRTSRNRLAGRNNASCSAVRAVTSFLHAGALRTIEKYPGSASGSVMYASVS